MLDLGIFLRPSTDKHSVVLQYRRMAGGVKKKKRESIEARERGQDMRGSLGSYESSWV